MQILIHDAMGRKHSRTIMADIVRCAVIELMTPKQLDRYFRARKVTWTSLSARGKPSILDGLTYEDGE